MNQWLTSKITISSKWHFQLMNLWSVSYIFWALYENLLFVQHDLFGSWLSSNSGWLSSAVSSIITHQQIWFWLAYFQNKHVFQHCSISIWIAVLVGSDLSWKILDRFYVNLDLNHQISSSCRYNCIMESIITAHGEDDQGMMVMGVHWLMQVRSCSHRVIILITIKTACN